MLAAKLRDRRTVRRLTVLFRTAMICSSVDDCASFPGPLNGPELTSRWIISTGQAQRGRQAYGRFYLGRIRAQLRCALTGPIGVEETCRHPSDLAKDSLTQVADEALSQYRDAVAASTRKGQRDSKRHQHEEVTVDKVAVRAAETIVYHPSHCNRECKRDKSGGCQRNRSEDRQPPMRPQRRQ